MKTQIDAVVFDVGNVLATFSYAHIAEALAEHSPLSPAEIESTLVGGSLEREAETGEYDSREYFRRVKAAIGGDPAWRYEEFVVGFKRSLALTDDGATAVRHAGERARVFLMSNTSYLHAQWMFEQEVLATVPEQMFLSFREGIMKPDARFWEIFFSRTHLAPARCLYFDDALENCEAAAGLGVNAVHFRTGEAKLVDALAPWF